MVEDWAVPGRVRDLTAYVYWWGTYNPQGITMKFTPEMVAEQMQIFHANNFIGIFLCYGGENWGLDGPAYYTFTRLLEDPNVDCNDTLEEYCNFIYGNGGPNMVEFFSTQHQRIMDLSIDDFFHDTPHGHYLTVYPNDVVLQLEQMLSDANDKIVSAVSAASNRSFRRQITDAMT